MHNPQQGWGNQAGEGGRTLDIHVGNVTEHDHQVPEKQGLSNSARAVLRTYSANREDSGTVDWALKLVIATWQILPNETKNRIVDIVLDSKFNLQ